MFLKTFEARNRHYSNRILIHIWSALPSLTVWSEFVSDWQLPPLNEQPIGTLSLWNDLWLAKVSRHGLDFLKPENRAMRRCRSLVFSQNTWITICWKVIMDFLPNDASVYSILSTLQFILYCLSFNYIYLFNYYFMYSVSFNHILNIDVLFCCIYVKHTELPLVYEMCYRNKLVIAKISTNTGCWILTTSVNKSF